MCCPQWHFLLFLTIRELNTCIRAPLNKFLVCHAIECPYMNALHIVLHVTCKCVCICVRVGEQTIFKIVFDYIAFVVLFLPSSSVCVRVDNWYGKKRLSCAFGFVIASDMKYNKIRKTNCQHKSIDSGFFSY